jgi:LysM repeat protein
MGVRLTKERVRVDQVVGEEKTQTVVEGIIRVPTEKPAVLQVISVEADLNNQSLETNILDGKVIVEGSIDVKVMYVAIAPEGRPLQPVHVVDGSVDFSTFAKIPGAKKNMDVRVKAKIEHIQFNVMDNERRQIQVRFILEVFVKVTQRVEIEIVIDATGPADLQILRKSIRVDDVVGEAKAQNIVKSDVDLPPGKPNIEQIIKVEGRVNNATLEVKIIDDKVIIEGDLEVGILYVAAVEEPPLQPVHFAEVTVRFTQFVEIPGAKEGMSKLVRVEVEAIRGRRKDENTITVEAILQIRAKVFETKVLNVIVDLFSPSERLEVEKTLLKVDQVIGEDENQVIVKEDLTIEEAQKPNIEQIFKANCRAEVEEARIIDNKVIVEGTLIIEILYVAAVDTPPLQPVHFLERRVPFTTFVEIPGAKEDMTLDFDVDVEHCSASVTAPNTREFEVRAVLRLTAKVTQMVQLEVVVDVEEPEEEEIPEEEKEKKEQEKPSMTIYIVQRGDTLWKIAKRYNVTIEAIVKANNIANPDSIMPGQQLVIPRRMF